MEDDPHVAHWVRWIWFGELPPEKIAPPIFWHCLLRAYLQVYAERAATSLTRAG